MPNALNATKNTVTMRFLGIPCKYLKGRFVMSYTLLSTSKSNTAWENIPIRKDIYSTERLGKYAEALAKHHKMTAKLLRVPSLYKRFEDNAQTLEQIVSKSKTHKRNSKDAPKGLDWYSTIITWLIHKFGKPH